MAQNKTVPTDASVDDFIAGVAPKQRQLDARDSLAIYQEVTRLEPVMWGPAIIGFGEQSYAYESGRSGIMPAAGFSPRKANMTYYVGDSFDGAEALYAKLGKHRKSVACLYINKLADVDVDVLRAIVAGDFAHNQMRQASSE